MKHTIMIGKKEFIHHTSKYLKMAEAGEELVITHRNEPCLYLVPVKKKSVHGLRALLKNVKLHEDINTPVIKGFDEW